MHTSVFDKEKFMFSKTSKLILISGFMLGLIVVLISIYISDIDSHEIWANILANNLFFLFLSLSAAVFLAIHKIALAGWHTSIQRIPEAMTKFLPFAAVLMFMVYFGMHDIYHWSHSEDLDAILKAKTAYLNIPFFFIRMAIYFLVWILLTRMMSKQNNSSVLDDKINKYDNSKLYAGIFLVFFAISQSTSSWDWLMSIDAHWFSTLYGWFVFSGMFVSGIAAIILIIAFVHLRGSMQFLNKEHIHDLGKYLFAFSIFWMYLWYFQYMLIWYANIPEETVYYYTRINNYKELFFIVPVVCFLIPFLALMSRGAKRNIIFISIVSAFVLIGQWLNLYVLILPGATNNMSQVGVISIGFLIMYACFYAFIVLRALSKYTILDNEELLLDESFNYENL